MFNSLLARSFLSVCVLGSSSTVLAESHYFETTLTAVRQAIHNVGCDATSNPGNSLFCTSGASRLCQSALGFDGGILQQLDQSRNIAHVLCLSGQREDAFLSELGRGCRGPWSQRTGLECNRGAARYCQENFGIAGGYIQEFNDLGGNGVVLCTDDLPDFVDLDTLDRQAFGRTGVCGAPWHAWSFLHCNSAASSYCRNVYARPGGGFVERSGRTGVILCH